MTNYHENDESNRIILNSSLTSQAVLNAKQLKKGDYYKSKWSILMIKMRNKINCFKDSLQVKA